MHQHHTNPPKDRAELRRISQHLKKSSVHCTHVYVLSHIDTCNYGSLLSPIRRVGLNQMQRVNNWQVSQHEVTAHTRASYPNGLRSKVPLADHHVSNFIQLDNGTGVGLDLRFKGLMFLQLALCDRPKPMMCLSV